MSFTAIGMAQQTVSGKVVDTDGNPIPGVNILVKGTANAGTISGVSGEYSIQVPSNDAVLIYRFVGMLTKEVNVEGRSTIDVTMEAADIGIAEVSILASVAEDRKTPVAVSSIKPIEIEEKLGSQEYPEILKSTPSVYATKAGGGYGDSRINIRGFDSRNIAVMINGVPVNDMENGKVYWSNWAGLSDVTRSMQVQRGFGAAKIAVPSIGGTINIITNTTDAKKGGVIRTSIGNDGYQKMGISLSTGLTKTGWAASVALSQTQGDGWVEGTQFKGHSYFLNISKRLNDNHTLALSVFGAPQQHNQRSYKQRVKDYKMYTGGIRYNANWGTLNGHILNVKKNVYHKPQAILNHYWTINSDLSLSTSAYASLGRGSGTSTTGTNDGKKKFQNYLYLGQVDLDRIASENIARGSQGSDAIIARSVNSHEWYGILSNLRKTFENITLSGGFDGRYYVGHHYRQVENLLGGLYYNDVNSKGKPTDVNKTSGVSNLGDKIAYYNDGQVAWLGLFGQVEYAYDKLSTFIAASVSRKSYKRIDYFNYADSDPMQTTDWQSYIGFSTKGGINYNLTEIHNVFANAGYMQRQPTFRDIFLNYKNIINPDAKNEKILGFEAGYGLRGSKLTANLNGFYTTWKDKSFVRSVYDRGTGQTYFANILGVNAIHMGIELDFVYRPTDRMKFTGMLSVGDYKWANDIDDVKIFNDQQKEIASYTLHLKDVHVGDAAQTTAAIGAQYELVKGVKLGFDYNYYSNLYAYFDPIKRQDASQGDAWKLPDYGLIDASLIYRFKMAGLDMSLIGKMNNVLNTEYFSDATDDKNHDLNSLVFYGMGRTWSASLKIKF